MESSSLSVRARWHAAATGSHGSGITGMTGFHFGSCPAKELLTFRTVTFAFPLQSTVSHRVSPVCKAIRIDRLKPRKQEDAIRTEEDLEICPAECVRELRSEAELEFVLRWGAEHGVLIVVDFFKTACGSCKYIETGFAKLCRAEGDQRLPVMFFKHNIMNDEEELSDIADRFRIKAVPLFHFYKDGVLVESFHTREKSRILGTIDKHIDHDIRLYLSEDE